MIVVDFAVGLVYIPVFERGIGPSGIGAGIRAIFRIGLIIEILDAGFEEAKVGISWNRCSESRTRPRRNPT